jgi:hypothetical protein
MGAAVATLPAIGPDERERRLLVSDGDWAGPALGLELGGDLSMDPTSVR